MDAYTYLILYLSGRSVDEIATQHSTTTSRVKEAMKSIGFCDYFDHHKHLARRANTNLWRRAVGLIQKDVMRQVMSNVATAAYTQGFTTTELSSLFGIPQQTLHTYIKGSNSTKRVRRWARLPEDITKEVLRRTLEGQSQRRIGKDLGIQQCVVSQVARRLRAKICNSPSSPGLPAPSAPSTP